MKNSPTSLSFFTVFTAAWLALPVFTRAAPLVYEGNSGPGKGKHIVLIANDHNYRSQETVPALARILAKHHGFKCTVLFGVDSKTGVIVPGEPILTGLESLMTADLLLVYTRWQNWPQDQMQHFVDYLNRGGPIVGLRTATHAFRIPEDAPFAKYSSNYPKEDYKDGFGRQILGETWNGHHGKNGVQSTSLPIVTGKAKNPILRGVKDMWVPSGGYFTAPKKDCDILSMAQPLNGMSSDSKVATDLEPTPAAWTRIYKGESGTIGRTFTSTYGASDDILNSGYRRLLINACFWATGLEDKIEPNADISFVGPYYPTWLNKVPPDFGKPEDLSAWDSPIGAIKK
jgi:hypothetical protein